MSHKTDYRRAGKQPYPFSREQLSEIEVCRHGDNPLCDKKPIPDKRIPQKELETICKKETQGYKADLAIHSGLSNKIILWDEV